MLHRSGASQGAGAAPGACRPTRPRRPAGQPATVPAASAEPDADAPTGGDAGAPQQVVKIRRDYNSWVVRETLEDYALRFAPQRFRRWSIFRVANTAFGAASFLILEAV